MRGLFQALMLALVCLTSMTASALASTQTWYVSGIFESSNKQKPALTGSFDFDTSNSLTSNMMLTAESGETTTACCTIDWDQVVFTWAGQSTYSQNDGRFYMFLYLNQHSAQHPVPSTAAMGLVFTGNPATSSKLPGVLQGQSDQGYCWISNGSCAGVNRNGNALFPYRDLVSLEMSMTPPETAGPAPVPLPAAASLLAGGLLALLGFGRLRHRG